MKGQGGIRKFMTAVGKALGRLKFWGGARTYPNPILRDPYANKRTRKSRGKARVAPQLQCEPGTVVYHDKLVSHFGRQKAEGYRIAIQRGHLNLLPTEQDFIDNPPWAFLK